MTQVASKLVDYSTVESLAKNQHSRKYEGIIQYGTAGFRMKYV